MFKWIIIDVLSYGAVYRLCVISMIDPRTQCHADEANLISMTQFCLNREISFCKIIMTLKIIHWKTGIKHESIFSPLLQEWTAVMLECKTDFVKFIPGVISSAGKACVGPTPSISLARRVPVCMSSWTCKPAGMAWPEAGNELWTTQGQGKLN